MRRVLFTAMAVLIGVGLAGTAQAQSNIIRFTAVLSGANETPAPGVLDRRVRECDRDAGHEYRRR